MGNPGRLRNLPRLEHSTHLISGWWLAPAPSAGILFECLLHASVGASRMSAPPTPPLRVGQVLDIAFAAFTARIAVHSARELTVKILEGDNAGFCDTVEYEAAVLREGLVVLSWREHIGSTIVH